MTPPQPLTGKTALITGSSSGIGRAIAIELARQGADVILHGRSDTSRLRAVHQKIKELGRDSKTVYSDFTQPTDWDQFVTTAWAWKGEVDFWINNAGGDVLTGEWAKQSTEAKLQFLWQVDVAATLLLSQRAGARMKDSTGSRHLILNIGWDQAWQGMAGPAGELFSTTKGAIMSMTKSLAQSFAPHVRVNCIAPGWIKTQWGEQASEYWSHRAQHESLMNRWGTPEDVAQVAAFLCSPAADFISGQIIPVNGGIRYGSASETEISFQTRETHD